MLPERPNPEPTNAEARAALWRNLTERFPHWLSDGADLTPVGTKALFEVVFGLAFVAGVKRGRADAPAESRMEALKRSNYVEFHLHLTKYLGDRKDGEGQAPGPEALDALSA